MPPWVLPIQRALPPPVGASPQWVPPPNLCPPVGARSQQQLEQLEGQRAAVQQELLQAREALSRAQLEAEVARGERAALDEALAQVGGRAPASSPGTSVSPDPVYIAPRDICIPKWHVCPWGQP